MSAATAADPQWTLEHYDTDFSWWMPLERLDKLKTHSEVRIVPEETNDAVTHASAVATAGAGVGLCDDPVKEEAARLRAEKEKATEVARLKAEK
jgi:hypothetical protein